MAIRNVSRVLEEQFYINFSAGYPANSVSGRTLPLCKLSLVTKKNAQRRLNEITVLTLTTDLHPLNMILAPAEVMTEL